MKKNLLKHTLSAIWLSLCGWCFIDFISNERAFSDSEISEFFYLMMSILTFPSGYIVVVAAYLVSELVRPFFEFNFNDQIGVTILFLLMTLVGYWQWFILIPSFFKRFFNVST